MSAKDDYILDILLEHGLVNERQVQEARQAAGQRGRPLETLVSLGHVTNENVMRAVAAHANVDFVDLSILTIPPEAIERMDAESARRYHVVPARWHDGVLTVATSNPLDFEALDTLRYVLQSEVELVCATQEQVKEALIRYYGDADDMASRLIEQLGEGAGTTESENELGAEESQAGDAPIIKLVSMLLIEAYKARASDIHLEPMERRFRVRFRIDGVLHEVQNPPKKLQAAIISRIKIMTRSMSIAEKRLPQDGRIQVKLTDKQIDLRVSTVPSSHGETVVMRILDKSSLLLGLPELGFMIDDQETFEKLITLPDGILLVTGPTGSGKTTTLYSCLSFINKPDRKIITVEHPVEYQLNGINQVQVNTEIGMSFPAALRSILRQAPNIIMIGEIRDFETANIAINASLTGHLVFSTLHTNDAPSAIARLIDIGIKPFLAASALRAVMAQRLVRRVCAKCKQPIDLSEEQWRNLRLDSSHTLEGNVMKGTGCENCRHTGYRGRMGIFEIFQIDDEVRHMVNDRLSTVQLRQRARELGMRTLREDGVRKVLAGMTTAEEVIAVTMSDVD